LEKGFKIDAFKELMSKNFIDIIFLPKTLLTVFLEEHGYQVLSFLRYKNFVSHGIWPLERGLLDE